MRGRFGYPYPHGVTVTFMRRVATGERDRLGREVYRDVPVDVPSCAVWPTWATGVAQEDVQARDLVTDMRSVAGPPDLAVDAYSAFVVEGRKYEVQGTPQRWRSPLTGHAPCTVVVGKVVTG